MKVGSVRGRLEVKRPGILQKQAGQRSGTAVVPEWSRSGPGVGPSGPAGGADWSRVVPSGPAGGADWSRVVPSGPASGTEWYGVGRRPWGVVRRVARRGTEWHGEWYGVARSGTAGARQWHGASLAGKRRQSGRTENLQMYVEIALDIIWLKVGSSQDLTLQTRISKASPNQQQSKESATERCKRKALNTQLGRPNSARGAAGAPSPNPGRRQLNPRNTRHRTFPGSEKRNKGKWF